MRLARIVLVAAGLSAAGYGLAGAVRDPGDNLGGHVAFGVAVLIGHDFLVLPAAIGIGALVVRYCPAWARAPVQAGLIASTVVAAVALPFVVGAGRSADNPSRLPLDYGRGLAIVLGTVWVVAAAWALWRRARRREHRSPEAR
jgi:hypothetical protein